MVIEPNMAAAAAVAARTIETFGVYYDKPVLRGQFHRIGAALYPPLFGVPLYLHATGVNRNLMSGMARMIGSNNVDGAAAAGLMNLPFASLLFSFAVEFILVASASLHTRVWKTEKARKIAGKLDFVAIFVGIASFYSSLGKLLFITPTGSSSGLFPIVEGAVWLCAIVGAATKWVAPQAPAYVNASIFLIQGWACLPLLPALFRTATKQEFAGLLSGAIFVTLGAMAYAFQWPTLLVKASRRKRKTTKTIASQREILFGPHEMFHAGTILMFLSFWYTMWVAISTRACS